MKIGIDFGGVIVEHDGLDSDSKKRTEDTNFNVNNVPWMPGCREVLQDLRKQGHQLYVVSFCGKKREQETRDALTKHMSDVLPPENWIFVRDRKLKMAKCQELGIEVMIDDRLDILQGFIQYQVPRVTRWLLWFKPETANQHAAKQILLCNDWSEVGNSIKTIVHSK